MKKIIAIEGMSCSHCSAAVTKALSSLKGASNVEVNLEKKQATLDVSDSLTEAELKDAVENQGYDVVSIANL